VILQLQVAGLYQGFSNPKMGRSAKADVKGFYSAITYIINAINSRSDVENAAMGLVES
jgi:hypothetical protein